MSKVVMLLGSFNLSKNGSQCMGSYVSFYEFVNFFQHFFQSSVHSSCVIHLPKDRSLMRTTTNCHQHKDSHIICMLLYFLLLSSIWWQTCSCICLIGFANFPPYNSVNQSKVQISNPKHHGESPHIRYWMNSSSLSYLLTLWRQPGVTSYQTSNWIS